MQKKCPLNRFKPCIGAHCGISIVRNEGESICSLTLIGHELFIMADLAIQHSSKALEKRGISAHPKVKNQEDTA